MDEEAFRLKVTLHKGEVQIHVIYAVPAAPAGLRCAG
jgi:hypothetical protein